MWHSIPPVIFSLILIVFFHHFVLCEKLLYLGVSDQFGAVTESNKSNKQGKNYPESWPLIEVSTVSWIFSYIVHFQGFTKCWLSDVFSIFH